MLMWTYSVNHHNNQRILVPRKQCHHLPPTRSPDDFRSRSAVNDTSVVSSIRLQLQAGDSADGKHVTALTSSLDLSGQFCLGFMEYVIQMQFLHCM